MSTPAIAANCTAGILAGGAGSRFGGQDKGFIELRGRPLIEWTLDAVRPQVREVLISANRNLERYRSLGVTVLSDEIPDEHAGPFAGMVRLLGAACSEWLLCVPCDAVTIPADLAERFAHCAAAEDADIVVLADAQGIHPTFSFIRAHLAADATTRFRAGERAPRRWFERHRLARLQGAPPVNLNTPEALAALESRL